MAEKFLKQISFTDKDNIKYWGYTFPGFDTSESTQKTSVLGTSKFAARADHSHKTDQLIEITDYLFMKNAERTKLGTYPDSYSTVKEYISEQVLGGNYKGSVEFFANLPTANLSDGDIYSVLKNTTGGNPAGDYRYHDNTTHPTGFATGWYLVSTNRVPLASSTYDGLLSSSDYDFIQTIKEFKGLIAQGSSVVTNLGGTTGSSEYAARADHLHDSRYLMLGGSTQTVAKQVNFSSYIQLGALSSSDIRDASGNSFLGGDSSMQIIGRQLGTTYLRSGATDLIHRKNGTDYTILDSSNIKALTLQFNGTTQITYNGLSPQTLNITPAAIGAAASSHSHNYLPLSGGVLTNNGATRVLTLDSGAGYETYLGINRYNTSKAAIGYFDSIGTYIYSYASGKYLFIGDDGNVKVGTTASQTNVSLEGHKHSNTYLPLSGGTLTGKLIINPTNVTSNFDEGLRIQPFSNGWATIQLGSEGINGSTNGWIVARRGENHNFFVGWETSLEAEGFVLYKNGNKPTWKGNELCYANDLNNYLPLSGGTISKSSIHPLVINSINNQYESTIRFDKDNNSKGTCGYYGSPFNGTFIFSYAAAKYLMICDDGLPRVVGSDGSKNQIACLATSQTWTAYQDFTAGAGNSGSDIRFKKDITPLPNILNDLRSIDIFSYIWNKENERAFDTFGVNADKLLEHSIFKKIVHERPDEEKTKFVDYDRIGVLALKGLQEEVEIREKKIQELENRLKKLEEKLGLI